MLSRSAHVPGCAPSKSNDDSFTPTSDAALDYVVAHARGCGGATELEPAFTTNQRGATCAASSPGITLNISVVDSNGESVEAGAIDCLYGAIGLESQTNPQREHREIDGAATSITLPISAREALVTVSAPGYHAAQTRVADLRRAAGRWVGDRESVERDVRVELNTRERLQPSVRGLVFVDGSARLPANLVVRAVSCPYMRGASSYETPRLAIVDTASGEYRFDALPAGAWRVEATSDETVKSLTPLLLADAARGAVADLRLASGAALVVEVRDVATRKALADRAIHLDYSVRGPSTEQVTVFDPVHVEARSDADGRCVFAQLPRDTSLLVTDGGDSRADAPRLELTISRLDAAELHRDLWIGGPDPTWVKYWGEVPAWLDDANASRSICARPTSSIDEPTRVAVEGSRWSISQPANVECDLWLERRSERASGSARVRARAGQQGPIALPQISQRHFTLKWTHAPVGWTAQVSTGDPVRRRSQTREVELRECRGSLALDRFDDGGLSIKVVGPDKSFVYWGWNAASLGDELSIDLHGDRPSSIALNLNGRPLERAADLMLVPMQCPAGVGTAFASIKLPAGGVSRAVPLFAGANFYRLVSACADPESAGYVVTGVVDADATEHRSGNQIALDWRGTLIGADQLGLGGRSGFEIVECAGRDVTASVSLAQRRVLREDLDWARRTSLDASFPSFFVDLDSCRLRPIDD